MKLDGKLFVIAILWTIPIVVGVFVVPSPLQTVMKKQVLVGMSAGVFFALLLCSLSLKLNEVED